MSTTLRNTWIAPPPPTTKRIYAMIKASNQRGVVWDGVPLDEQIARDAIAVIVEEGKAAQYYQRHEIEIEQHVC